MAQLLVSEFNDQLNCTLQQIIQKCYDECKDDVFTVGVSGGSMVSTLCLILPKLETNWKKWKFFCCDERLVPFDDKESTLGAYMKHLAATINITNDQFLSIDPNLYGNECALHYANQIKNNVLISKENQLPRFDLLLLGMGPDGHTCSLFPNHHLLKVCLVHDKL